MVATATRTILENLDRIPDEDERTKIAIICFDVSLYFFSLPPGQADPTMLVVSDVDDVFLPKPTDLLLNLAEARSGINEQDAQGYIAVETRAITNRDLTHSLSL